MKKIFLFFLAMSCYITLIAQGVAINTDGSSPHPSAMLDIKSGTKGFLMPRTSTASKLSILNPPTGLTIYDSTIGSFWFRNAGFWIESGRIDPINSNSFFGYQSGRSQPTGDFNSGFGTEALYANTTGIGNTSIGNGTLHSNTVGNYNTANGMSALYFNTSGYSNTAIGNNALLSNQTGYSNVAVGSGALFHNTVGTNSVAIGDSALFYNDGAFGNTAIGDQALFFHSLGRWNTALGSWALRSNSQGVSNVAIGFQSMEHNSGDSNVAVGAFADVQGHVNTAIGISTVVTGDLRYATAIGAFATVGCSNCLVLGGYDAIRRTKVGICTPNPQSDLHIVQQSNANFDLSRGIRLQSPNGKFWHFFLDPGNNFVFEYNTGVFAYIDPITGNFVSTSDSRLKTNITSLPGVLDKVLSLEPKTYQYSASIDANRYTFGFLAQDVEKIFPDFVYTGEGGYKGIAYSNFSVVAIKAIQEQQELIIKLQKKNDEHEEREEQFQKQIKTLLERVEALEKKSQ